MTSKDDIWSWFNSGIRDGYQYMIIKCDTFSYEDYPVYCNADTYKEEAKCGEMERIREVYDLTEDVFSQLEEHRAFHPPQGTSDEQD